MKKLLFVTAFSVVIFLGGYVMAIVPATPVHKDDTVEHGGGCRKSSPPGQCCHKNRKTGEVHCH